MIVVAGSANTDLVAQVTHHPAPGETLLASGHAVHQGGKGANQAVAAARLGASVRFIGAVGNDDFGSGIVASLADEGIDTHYIQHLAGTSGLALITVDETGENRIVVIPGANGLLDDSCDFDSGMAGASVVLTQLETPLGFVNAALKAGHLAGAETILNASPAAPLARLDTTRIDWLLVNAGETACLLGEQEQPTREGILDQVRQLASHHATGVVATLGPDGALWVARDGSQGHVPGLQVEVVDTTGAGDTFAGAFAHARACGSDIHTAIETAVLAGSLSVRKAGARAGMPGADELASFTR